MTATSAQTTQVRDPLQSAVWLAATVGSFRPGDLLAKVSEDVNQRRVLATRLAALCSEVVSGGARFWSLGADARRRAFAEMNQAGIARSGGLTSLIDRLPPVPEDHFGRYLRDALAGRPASGASDSGDLDARYAAYEFVGRSEAGVNPALVRESAGVIEQQAQRNASERDLRQAIGKVFVDRERQCAALIEFARSGVVNDPEYRQYAKPGPGRVPLLFVNGVGGAGKSALIAKLVQTLRGDSSGIAATIILDFDRPMLANLDPVELSLEFARQLGVCQPTIAKDVIELRRTGLNEFSADEFATANVANAYASSERALYSLNARLSDIAARVQLNARPVLLILDTFEEVLSLGPDYVDRIYRWLEDFRSQVNLSMLRVILSGRATPEELDSTPAAGSLSPGAGGNVVGIVTVGDLPESFAIQILANGGIVDVELARQLVSHFGANPLVLRLLSDYSTQHDGDAAVRALLKNEDLRQKYQASAAQRILYSRILGRIRDGDGLRALASPGLIVRLVTPGVIREVLAEPCGLGRISPQRAEELFGGLAKQIWLVRRQGESVVTHRRDMRTVMLPLANQPKEGIAREDLAESIRSIHERAIRFHRGPAAADPELSAEQRRNEAFYHELFIDPAAAFANPALEKALPSLGVDVEDFPTATRARLKQMLGRSLSGDEVAALDSARQADYRSSRAQQQLKSTGMGAQSASGPAASDNSPVRRTPVSSPARKALDPKDSAGIMASFAVAEFEQIADIARPLLLWFVRRVQSKSGV